MSDRPILFSAPMVRALLTGTKTQTRRLVKPQPAPHETWDWSWPVPRGTPGTRICWRDDVRQPNLFPYCPYGVPGDTLWVREAHALSMPVRYVATDAIHELRKKRPSIHMPRWASRITLKITDVRVERLHDISEADALAEGIVEKPDRIWWVDDGDPEHGFGSPRAAYAELWSSINGPGSWDANPWVWAVSFEVSQ